MFNLNLLSFFTEQPEKVTDVVSISLIVTLICLAIIVAVLATKTKLIPTKTLTMGAVSISLSFVLSFLKIKIGVNGGSVTLLSMVPILLFCFTYGYVPGLLASVIYAILQFLSSPYIFTFYTFFLDYIFAYGVTCLVPLFKKAIKNTSLAISLGVIAVYLLRLIFATLSGIEYFNAGWVYDGYPKSSAFIYSIVYNTLYIIPDMILCIAFLAPFAKSKYYELLLNYQTK